MGVADGSVTGLTKIFDSGSPSDKWNLVIVAEGFTAADQATFQARAQDLVDHILATPPFDEGATACAINAYRLDVVSNQAGADSPVCGDGSGTGAATNTYFDATFCSDGAIRRLASGDGGLVIDTVDDFLPEWHQIIVLINDLERAGAGGTVAWTTIGGDWMDVSLHEIGHSAFGLADEYDCYTCVAGETGRDNFTGAEPVEPNVSTEGDPASVKWSALVTAGPGVTMANPNCTQQNLGPSPVPAGTVGTFEGAQYFHCGLFRPEYNCMMRATGDPFCAVCRQEIRDTYAPFAVAAPGGGVTAPSLAVTFNDVPEGTTTVRAARFEVDSCVGVTFQSTLAPSAPFSLESPAVLAASPSGAAPWSAYFWYRYTAGAPGTINNSTARILCVETGETFEFTLTANSVARPRIAVQLVFDQSGSMLDVTDEGRRKEQVLRDSARAFIDLMYDDNGVGINAYDHDPHPVMDVAEALAPGDGGGRDAAYGHIAAYAANPSGATAIGDGIELAKAKLDAAAGYDQKAMVVLTDGQETAAKYISEVAGSVINEKVFAIGLGEPSQIQPSALNALANGTGAYLVMTGNIGADDTFLLQKYYLQILAGVNNNEIVLDPDGFVPPGQTVRIPFEVNEADIEITGVILTLAPWVLRFALETPDGSIIDEAFSQGDPSVLFRRSQQTVFIRTSLPVLAGGNPAHAGRWHLLLKVDDKYFKKYISGLRDRPEELQSALAHGIKYSANVYAYSNLRMRARVSQTGFAPGAGLTLRAELTEYGVPFAGRAHVTIDMTRPGGAMETIVPALVSPGVFEAARTASADGLYTFRFKARGKTRRDIPFTREHVATASVWHGSDRDPPGGGTPGGGGPGSGPGDFGILLECLFCTDVMSRELRERLEKAGLDIEKLRKCVCGKLKRRQAGTAPPTTATVPEIDFLGALEAAIAALRR
jgi:IgA Peptidase M64/von Willebrand factor type A domain